MPQITELNSDALAEWKRQVLERDNSTCVNCERTTKVAPAFVIPPEAGGRLRPSNGVTVCRECRINAECARVLPQRIDNKTPINFFISKALHANLEKFVRDNSHFGSISALIRHMISAFITAPELFDDLSMWQDRGSDVKVNGWVDGSCYETFKKMCQERGLSFTDAFKSLLLVAMDRGSTSH